MHHEQEERRSQNLRNRLRRRIRDFNTQWGDILQACLSTAILVLAAVLFIIALNVRSLNLSNQQQSAAAEESAAKSSAQSKKNCERAKLIGPYTLADYKARHILPPNIAEVYEKAIPKSC